MHRVVPSRWRVAPLLDLACLVGFVLGGRSSHEIHAGTRWFLTVLWPVALGWFAAALAVHLYTRADRPSVRLLATWAAGVALAAVLRDSVTHRPTVSTFTLVMAAFVLATTAGWRVVGLAAARVRSARSARSARPAA